MTYNIDFSERELMNDLLMSEKQMATVYNLGICEATCGKLRHILNKCMNNVQDCQYDIYNAMKQRGWYQVKEANSKDVENAIKKFSHILNNLH